MANSFKVTQLFKTRSPSLKQPTHMYRILPFERVVEMFQTNKLTLVSPLKWDDPFEKHWIEVLFPDDALRQKNVGRIYGCCFTKESRSDALWRIYSPTYLGVRIKIDIEKFIEQVGLIRNHSGNMFVGDVKYQTDKNLIDISKSIGKNRIVSDDEIIKPWFNKRLAFSHENEMRVLYVSHDDERTNNDIISFDVDPRTFITSMLVDSRAPASLSEALLSHLKLVSGMSGSLVKQSSLYKLPQALRKTK
jgi:hypothetical protein